VAELLLRSPAAEEELLLRSSAAEEELLLRSSAEGAAVNAAVADELHRSPGEHRA